MIGFLIVFIIMAFICTLWFSYGSIDAMDIVFGGLMGLIISLFLFLVISCVITSNCKTEAYISSEQQIYALQDNNSVKGSFFLGSGSIDGTMKYAYLIKSEDGVEIKYIDSDGVIIVEEDSNKPRIITYSNRFTSGFWNKMSWCTISDKTKIYIPKNSVKYDYKVDLE
jgi:hypothetical protein